MRRFEITILQTLHDDQMEEGDTVGGGDVTRSRPVK
jgi:hypothetical protein